MKSQKGYVLILVMIFLLMGSLIIAPLLSLMMTGLKAGQVNEEKMFAFYAADAGIEDALWRIAHVGEAGHPDNLPTDSYYLAGTVNDMLVSVLIEEHLDFYDEYIETGQSHTFYFELESRLIDYYEKEGSPGVYIYGYELTLTNKTNSPVSLHSIRIGFPVELWYIEGLYTNQADLDEGRLAPPPMNDFDSGVLGERESEGMKVITWDFPSPVPQISAAPDPDSEIYTTVTTTFVLEGPEGLGISNFLVRTNRIDIGTIWEYKPFIITAKAYDDEGAVVTTITVRASKLSAGGTASITHWKEE